MGILSVYEHDKDHERLGTPRPNASGAFEGIYITRSGTLASLSGIAGNANEMAAATSPTSIVLLSGVANGAKIFYPSEFAASCLVAGDAVLVPAATPTILQLSLISIPKGNTILLPSISVGDLLFPTVDLGVSLEISIDLTASATPGTYFKLELQDTSNGSTWITIATQTIPVVVSQPQILQLKKDNIITKSKLRFRLTTDATGGRVVLAASVRVEMLV